MLNRNPRALIFDLDGTLQDTYTIHSQAFLATLKHFGISVTEQEYQAAYSPNWLRSYQILGLPRADWEAADAFWLVEAAQSSPQPFPGVPAALDILRTRYALGIVTSGDKNRVHPELAHNGLDAYFQVVISGDDVPNRKPAPDGILLALHMLGISPADCIYVGDTDLDYETAQAAGVGFIGVPSQFNSLPPELPCLKLEDVTQLVQILIP